MGGARGHADNDFHSHLDDISYQNVSPLASALCTRVVPNNENAAPIAMGEVLVVRLWTGLDPSDRLLRYQLLQRQAKTR